MLIRKMMKRLLMEKNTPTHSRPHRVTYNFKKPLPHNETFHSILALLNIPKNRCPTTGPPPPSHPPQHRGLILRHKMPTARPQPWPQDEAPWRDPTSRPGRHDWSSTKPMGLSHSKDIFSRSSISISLS